MRLQKAKLNTKRACAFVHAAIVMGLFAFVFALSQSAHAGAWPEHLGKISKLKSETTSLEAELKHLIQEKREAHGDAQIRELTLTIAAKYKELKTASEKLESETTHVRFKHPEQADLLERKYTRYNLKSLDDLASEVGIDGRLDRIKARVVEIFPGGMEEKALASEPKVSPLLRRPASIDEDDGDAPERIVLKK